MVVRRPTAALITRSARVCLCPVPNSACSAIACRRSRHGGVRDTVERMCDSCVPRRSERATPAGGQKSRQVHRPCWICPAASLARCSPENQEAGWRGCRCACTATPDRRTTGRSVPSRQRCQRRRFRPERSHWKDEPVEISNHRHDLRVQRTVDGGAGLSATPPTVGQNLWSRLRSLLEVPAVGGSIRPGWAPAPITAAMVGVAFWWGWRRRPPGRGPTCLSCSWSARCWPVAGGFLSAVKVCSVRA